MPTKVLPTIETFAWFREVLLRHGFREISTVEFKKDFRRLKLIAPSPREGREAGFQFSSNGLEVVVWTTFLTQHGYARETDAGWVLIKDGDNPRYFKMLRRTKNFLRNLLYYAIIAQRRAKNRPLCDLCDKRMKIAFGKGIKSRYWSCTDSSHARNKTSKSWDTGLSPAAIDFLKPERRRKARYVAKLRAEGKNPGTAIKRRKGWTVGRPENIVSKR